VPLDILNIVEPGSKGVIDINNEDLPVGLSFIEEGHDTEDLDLLDLTGVTDGLSNLTDVERVVVTVSAGLGVLDGWVFPSLREGSVVPDVTWWSACPYIEMTLTEHTMVGETVPDESEFTLLDI
jgi:hypothetical protein